MAEALTRDTIVKEAMSIITALRENARAGRSNKLADVKAAFDGSVSVEFDTYFFFLRKFHFIGMDREACLQLTTEGEKVIDGERKDRFAEAVQDYFASRIAAAAGTSEELIDPPTNGAGGPPPPPPDAVVSVEVEPPKPIVAPPPPPFKSKRRADPEIKIEKPSIQERTPTEVPGISSRVDSPAPVKGQEIDLRYVKYDPVGQGPLGTVYRGRHTALGLDVCIKELKDIFGYFSFLQRSEVIKRLKRELCAQALVRHPCVVPILDQNCDVARPYYVMELCPGGNLRQKLDAAGGKGLEVEPAIRMFLQLCYAMKVAHAAGLTHGNLKPENVMFDAYGNVRLGDFGLSRVIEVDPAKGMPQVFVGTGGMSYMSPEQITRSTKDFGPASDVYSAGIILYEMLTGKIPGRRSPLPSEMNPKVPTKIDAIFDKMTQDRREDRQADFDVVLNEFYDAFEGDGYLKKGDLILSSDAPAAAQQKQEG